MGCSGCSKGRVTINNNMSFYRSLPNHTPAEYLFVDENSKEFRHQDLETIVAQIVQYRFENKLPDIAYLNEAIQTFTLLHDDKYIPFREAYTPNVEVPLSVKTLITGAIGYFKAAVAGESAFVELPTAEVRAGVCLNCPYNATIVNGNTKESPNLAQSKFCALRGTRRVSVEGGLQICAKCTCLNACKVWFKKEVIREGTPPTTLKSFEGEWLGLNGMPMHCWIPTDSGVE